MALGFEFPLRPDFGWSGAAVHPGGGGLLNTEVNTVGFLHIQRFNICELNQPQIKASQTKKKKKKKKKKIPESSKEQNLNLLGEATLLYIVFTIIFVASGILSNLEMIYSVWEDVDRLHADIRPFDTRDSSIIGFWSLWGSWDSSNIRKTMALFLPSASADWLFKPVILNPSFMF